MCSLFTVKDNEQKVRFLFDSVSSDGKSLNKMEALRFFAELGLSSELFLRDLHYYFPKLAKQSLLYEECLQFLDFLLNNRKQEEQKLEAFKSFDRNGNGQVCTAELLAALKKSLPSKEYDLLSQMVSTSFGPSINYMEVFRVKKVK